MPVNGLLGVDFFAGDDKNHPGLVIVVGRIKGTRRKLIFTRFVLGLFLPRRKNVEMGSGTMPLT
jgi:hypothetical protein